MDVGCKIKASKAGFLAYRLFFNGIRSWEGTKLGDTPENRKVMEAEAVLISREINNGKFDYLKWFPNGNRLDLFTLAPKIKTVSDYFPDWLLDKNPPLVRKSLARDCRQHMNAYILPKLGDIAMEAVGVTDIKNLRLYLIEDRGLTVKTAKNIVSGTLRAFFRDAEAEGLIEQSPFANIPERWWPAVEEPEPDPYTEVDRDKLLNYYRRHRLQKNQWPGHFREATALHLFRYLYFQFWTGWRPSEATALRWGRVDLARGTGNVVRSRSLGAEAAPKTKKSKRTVEFLPNVVAMLKEMKPLHVTEDDYVFVNTEGRPLRMDNIRIKTWYNAHRATGVRPRSPKQTRHTFISVMLSYGMNPEKVAQLCGNSTATINKHYAKYIRYNDDAGLRALAASEMQSAMAPDALTINRTKAPKISSKTPWWSQRDSNPCTPAQEKSKQVADNIEEKTENTHTSSGPSTDQKSVKKGGK